VPERPLLRLATMTQARRGQTVDLHCQRAQGSPNDPLRHIRFRMMSGLACAGSGSWR